MNIRTGSQISLYSSFDKITVSRMEDTSPRRNCKSSLSPVISISLFFPLYSDDFYYDESVE